MRAVSAAQQAVLDSGVQAEFARISVKDGSEWRDLTTWPGFDAVEELSWKADVNEPHATFDAKLKRELFSLSLSPYVEGSGLNHAFDSSSSFAALIRLNAEVKIEAAIVPMDTAPQAGDWFEVFRGRIDSLDAAAGPCVAIGGRDLAGRLAQQYIKLERVYAFAADGGSAVSLRIWAPEVDVTAGEYLVPASRGEDDPGFDKFLKCATTGTTGTVEPVWTAGAGQADGSAAWDYVGAPSTAGFPVEEIIQNILDDNLGAGDSAVTLYVPSSPGWDITEYLQERGFTLDAARTLATQIGWDARHKWKAADSTFAFTLFEPDRDDPGVDHTFAARDYGEPTRLSVDIATLRNKLKLIFRDKADTWPDGTAKRKELTYSDPTSIAKYGELWSEIQEDETKNIDTSTEADRLGAAFISDCSEPTAEFAVPLTRGFPWVELNDFDTFEPDGRRADGTLSLAVTGWTQTFSSGRLLTQLQLRGKPTIGHEVHLAREFHPHRPPKEKAHRLQHFQAPQTINPEFRQIVGGIQVDFPTAGRALKDQLLAEYEIHVSKDPGFMPDSSSLLAVVKGTETSIPWQEPDAGYYAKAVPRWYNDGKLVRGQPSVEKSFTSGQGKAGHLKQEVEWGRLPLNGGFETWSFGAENAPDHWAVDDDDFVAGNVIGSQADADSMSGDSHCVYRAHLGDAELTTKRPFVVSKGTSYDVAWAVRLVTDGAAGAVSIYVRWLEWDLTPISDDLADTADVAGGDAVPVDGEWHVRSGAVTAPSGARFAKVLIKRSTEPDDTFALHIDDVRLERA